MKVKPPQKKNYTRVKVKGTNAEFPILPVVAIPVDRTKALVYMNCKDFNCFYSSITV